MDISNIQYQLRRRRLDEIFDFAILLCRTHWRGYLAVAAPGIAVFCLFNWLVIWIAGRYAETIEFWSWAHLGLFLLVFAQCSLLSLPLALLNGNLLFDQKPRLRDILAQSLKLSPRFLWRQAIVRPLLAFWLAPSVITVWIALVTRFFESYVIVLERLGGKQASQRLGAMSSGQSERTVAFWFLEAGILLIYFPVMGFCYGQLLEMLDLSGVHWMLEPGWPLTSPPMHLFLFAFFVYHSAAKFLYYIDARSMREGWDVELSLIRGVRETEGTS